MTYFDSHMDNIFWFWSVVVAGGSPAVLYQLANDPKTREAQVSDVECLFEEPLVLTSQPLASSLKPTSSLQIISTSSISWPSDSTNKTLQVEDGNTSSGDLATILFTSGSTGSSKAVEFSHVQLIASVVDKAAFHGTHSETNFGSWICRLQSTNFLPSSNQAAQLLIILQTFVKLTCTHYMHAQIRSISLLQILLASQRNFSIFYADIRLDTLSFRTPS